MANYLASRSSNLSSFNAIAMNYSTLTVSTLSGVSTLNVSRVITTSTIQVNSSMISLGNSTNQVYVSSLSYGNFSTATTWVTSLTNRLSTATVLMSANAQYQMTVSPSTTVSSIMYTSTLGQSWTTISAATGLPSATATSYTAGAISGDGQYAALGAYGGYLYTTANSGQSWTNTNPNTPAIYLPLNGSVTDTIGTSNPSVQGTNAGSIAYVSGIVGTRAINLINPPAGTAAQFVKGTWTAVSNFSVSLWINPQSASASMIIFSIGSALQIQTNGTSGLQLTAPGISSSVSYPVATNIWYNITVIFQANSTCYFYVNNVLIASPTSTGSVPSGSYSLGTYDSGTSNAFNGYIDDLKIYNSAITFTPMVPQNWSNVNVSNTGQYMLATATGAGLYISSNFGSTWTQVTGTLLAALWSAAQVSATGQYMLAYAPLQNVQPQLSGLSSSTGSVTWQVNSISWTATASSFLSASSYPIGYVFNTYSPNGSWANSLQNYTSTGNTATATTIILGVGAIGGDWIQIQSSVPIVLYSYQLGLGGSQPQMPQTFYIVGSTDRISWYPIQYASIAAQPSTAVQTLVPSVILANSTATQTYGSTTLTGTTYATTANTYTYFRLIARTIFNATSLYLEIGQWVINFQAGGQTYSTNYGSTWNNGYTIPTPIVSLSESGQYALGAAAISPQQTGLTGSSAPATVATTTWQQNGITWTSNASSVINAVGYQPWIAFNNVGNPPGPSLYSWASAPNYSAGTYNNTYSTPISSPAAQTYYGEWLQIYSSVPLVLYSYNFASGGLNLNFPRTYFIVGSTDTSIWYPIQLVTLSSNPFTAGNINAISPAIIVNSSASQTINGGTAVSFTPTIYSTTTNAYNYFRIIANSTSSSYFELAEWYVNFLNPGSTTTYTVVPNYLSGFSIGTYTSGTIPGVITNTAVSNNGQYMVIITNATAGNNVYYSINYGATFTGLQLGTQTLTSCSISYDGSYITIASAATVYTLNNNSTGFSLALGNQAGYQNQANNAIAIGNYAGYQNQTANSIILNASGSVVNAVAPGFYVAPIASYTSSSSQSFALLGYGTDSQITQGIGSVSTVLSNIFLGQNAGQSNTTGYANIYIGQNVGVLNTTGFQNIGIGQSTGYSITTAYNTTIVGTNSGQQLTTGFNNCFFGTGAGLFTTTGNSNTFLGILTGGNNTTGSSNVCIGASSGQGLTTGLYNTIVGNSACQIGTLTGQYNATLGFQSAFNLSSGIGNVGLGWGSLPVVTTGNYNIGLGVNAGGIVASGTFNMYLGTNAIASSPTVSNEIVISSCQYNGQGKGGNTFFLNVRDNNNNAGVAYQANNSSAWATTSDRRIKRNITDVSNGLNIILALHPVEFDYIITNIHDTGFIAQEYQNILPKQITHHSATGIEIDLVGEGNKVMGIQQNLVPYIVKAIQEQHTKIVALKQQIRDMTSQQDIFVSQLAALTQRLAAAGIP